MNDLFVQNDFRQQYALAKEQGDKRFGSECKHVETRNGYCLNCLRRVVTVTHVHPGQEAWDALQAVPAYVERTLA